MGHNTSIPPTYIDPRSTPRSKNTQVWRGLLEKRRGGVDFGTTMGERVLAVGSFRRSGVQYIFRIGPTKFEWWNGTAWESRAFAALTANDTHIVDWVIPDLLGEKTLIYTNSLDAIRKWDGGATDAALGGSPPKAKYLVYFRGYMLALNTEETGTAFPSRVRRSDAGDIEEWSAGDAGADDLLDDDKEITGGKVFGEYAAIHKETGIYLGYLTNTSSVIRYDRREAQGTVAGRTIVNLPDGSQIYLSRTGIRIFNGLNSPFIDSPINEQLREEMNPEFLYRAFALSMDSLNEVWFFIPIGDDENPSTVYKYNYITRQLYVDEREGATAAGIFEVLDRETWDEDPEPWDSDLSSWNTAALAELAPRAMIGFEGGVTVERTGSANDSGEAVDTEWESKDFTAADFGFDDPEGISLEWQGVEVVAKGTAVDVYYSLDEGLNFTLAQSLTLGSDWPTYSNKKIAYFRAFNDKCRFKLKNNAVNGAFSFKQLRPIIVPREGHR